MKQGHIQQNIVAITRTLLPLMLSVAWSTNGLELVTALPTMEIVRLGEWYTSHGLAFPTEFAKLRDDDNIGLPPMLYRLGLRVRGAIRG